MGGTLIQTFAQFFSSLIDAGDELRGGRTAVYTKANIIQVLEYLSISPHLQCSHMQSVTYDHRSMQ